MSHFHVLVHATHTQIPSRLPSVSLTQVFQGPAVCTKTYLFPSRMQGVMSGEVEPAPYSVEREILKVTTLLVSLRCGSWWGSGGFLVWKSMFFAVKMLEPNRKTDSLLNLPSHMWSHSCVLSKASLKGSTSPVAFADVDNQRKWKQQQQNPCLNLSRHQLQHVCTH